MAENALDVAAYKEQVFGTTQPATASAAPSTTTSEEKEVKVTPTSDPANNVPRETIVEQTPEKTVPQFDPVVFLKEQLGYDSVEAAKADKAAYEALKLAPTKPAEYKFENEESQKIATYIKEGKRKELKAYLDGQELVESFEGQTEEQKLKTFLKIQNPLYDQELIDARFAREYTFNDASFKDEDGNITDPVAYRLAKIDVQQKMQLDLQKANDYISNQKTKIVLPDIQPAQQATDPEYQAYKDSLKQDEENAKLVTAGLAKITEKEATYNFKFSDEASKLNAEISYVPDAETLKAAKDGVSDLFGFLNKHFVKDGSPLTDKLTQGLAILSNLDAYAREITIQAINAERKRMLSQAKNIGDGVQKNYAQQVPDAIQSYKEQVFGKTG